MQFLINTGIILCTLAGMEGFSWFIHKYLFHGPLWFIHKSHHQVNKSWFELNDIFSLGFALAAMSLILTGLNPIDFKFYVGVGISLYGTIYFIFHDGFIHRRFDTFNFGGGYLKGLRKAHKIHHKSMQKLPSKEYGLLIVGQKNFKTNHSEKVGSSREP
ncbi:MAG: sterol desaturase family protein [Flavobacterium sp.]|nr:sterol desaturase family protein [Pedobacter sp.]